MSQTVILFQHILTNCVKIEKIITNDTNQMKHITV